MATEVWSFQDGTTEKDLLSDAAYGYNNTFVFVGTTYGNWGGVNAGGGDMTATKLDIHGNILWKWQNGTSETDWANAVGVADDGSIVIGGYRENGSAFVAVKLDADGTFVWQREDGTDEAGLTNTLAMWEDGSVILAGSTEGDWNQTNKGNEDFAAWKLNPDGSSQWKWQNGTEQEDFFNCSVALNDGSVIMAGASAGNWNTANAGEVDFAAVKLDSDGNELWRWQDGTAKRDIVYDVTIGLGGSVFLVGQTYGSWDSTNLGLTDFAAVKLDADGNEVWRWQSGTAGYDRWLGVLAKADGSIVLAGVTWGEWGDSHAGAADYAAIQLDENKTEVWRWQRGSSQWDIMFAIASSESSSQVLVAGQTTAPLATGILSSYSFAAFLLDTSTPASASPTSTPSQAQLPDPNAQLSVAPTSVDGPTESPGERSGYVPTSMPSTDTPLSTQTSSPTLKADGTSFMTTTVVALLSSTVVLLVVMGAGWVYRRLFRMQGDDTASPAERVSPESTFVNATSHPNAGIPSERSGPRRHEHDVSSVHIPQKATTEAFSQGLFDTMAVLPGVDDGRGVDILLQPNNAQGEVVGNIENNGRYIRHQSSGQAPTEGGAECSPVDDGDTVNAMSESGADGNVSISGNRQPARGIGVAHAVMGAAQELSQMSQIPGVAEAAGLVIVLVNMVTDSSDIIRDADNIVQRCRSVTFLLQRAASVLNEADNTIEAAHHALIEDVRHAVGDLVEIIQMYKSKGKLSQVMISTLFKRRQKEAEAVIEAAISRLHLGLHIQVGDKLTKLGQDLRGGLYLQQQGLERSEPDRTARLSVEARRMRRQRDLDKVEIPEHDVTVTNELLGKGGFGTVYIADYNGRNAAAKVVQVEHDLGKLESLKQEVVCGTRQIEPKKDHDHSRRQAFWRELQAMIRLRSPHTVHVFGAITSRQDRLVLVMELLPGGDLCSLLKNAKEPLAEDHARRIIGDICTGMSFLHHKETVHGDLKSPNVLLDGTGRAKIGDFGTSKWPQLTNSTGLATYTAGANHSTKMSFAWAAPEVLDSHEASYASDVYSFGVVVWEVLCRKLPWADECLRNIYVRVVIKHQRPEIPRDAPADLQTVINACWQCTPNVRPTFDDTLKSISRV